MGHLSARQSKGDNEGEKAHRDKASCSCFHANTWNWQSFLRNDENKQELFRFLATKCVHYQTADEKEIYSTFEDEFLGSSNSVVSSVINPCSHEDADTRIFMHVNEIAQTGHSKVMVRTIDTDNCLCIFS